MSEFIKVSKEKQIVLNNLVERLVNNQEVAQFYQENLETLKSINAFDVFSISYFQEDSKLEIEVIKKIAGKLINLLYTSLNDYQWEKEDTSILMKYLLLESLEIKKKFDEIKPMIKDRVDYISLLPYFQKFKVLNKRFLKMQNIIFPRLEKRINNSRPLQIMWSLHDDAKELLDELLEKIVAGDSNLNQIVGKYFFLVYGILEKEELLVLPLASHLIKKEEWDEMMKEALDYGFSFLKVNHQTTSQEVEASLDKDLLFNSKTGGLSLEELILILNRLPLDLTFVDEFNQVKYYNNTKSRVFPRSPSVIGRMVDKCHPPKSVHLVEEIIEEFRSGNKDQARFWFKTKGRFLLITYYALRDKSGKYKGVLEVGEDITEISSLSGEQRLLNWEK